jgi:inner membrane protein
MEPVTHTLAALMMSRAGLNRWCGRATLVVLVAANVPDLDFVSSFGGDQRILEWHRGPTHSLLLAPLVALLPLMLLWPLLRRRTRWRRAYVVSLVGVLSHCLIDWTNVYGVRLLEPWRQEWRRLDLNSVVDFWISAILIGAAGWLALARLVSSEIGARPPGGRGVAIFALAAVLAFDTGRYFLRQRALEVLDARLYEGEAPARVAAFPTIFSPFRWQGLVETSNAYRMFDVNLLAGQFDPAAGKTYYKPDRAPLMDLARQTQAFETFFWFAKYPLWRLVPAEEPEGAWKVQALDLRFADPGEDHFCVTAIVTEDEQILRSWFQYEPPGARPRVR